MALTTKELVLIQENIKRSENSIKFMQGCSEATADPQVRNLCQSMITEHTTDMQTLMKHINSATIQ
jgi:hypothetical protein